MTQETAAPAAVRDEVRDYLTAALKKAGRTEELRDDDDLLLVLDSLHLLRMVLELESRYGVAIGNADMTPENLGTIDRIAAFVTARRSDDGSGDDLARRPR